MLHVRSLLQELGVGEVAEVGLEKRFGILTGRRLWYRHRDGAISEHPETPAASSQEG
jgi:hypothetical protein